MRGFSHFSSYCCLGTNFREWLNIQNRDPFPSGPSLMNSWPRGLPHFPQRTFRAEGSTPGGMSTRPLLVSIFLVRESVRTGLEKAGQGVWCLYFSVLKKSPSAYLPNLPRKILPREKRMITFAAHVHSRIEIVSMDLLFRPRTKRHFEMFCLKSIWELNILLFTRYLLNKTMNEHPLSRLPCILFNS